MATLSGHNRRADWRRKSGGSMYAIVFDMDVTLLEQTYPSPHWRNADRDVRDLLERRRFDWQQGSTYFGNEAVTAVDGVLAVQEVNCAYHWLRPSVRDIRMLRIAENNDLGPALG